MPLGRRELAGDDGGAGGIAILEDLQEVAALLILHGGEGEVVDHQDVEARELGEQANVGAIGPGQDQLVKEPGGAPVEGAVALAAGLVPGRRR